MNVGKMMKDLQRMQSKLQAEIEAIEVEVSSGGGMVTARMNGKKELLSLKILPESITPNDPELMEDLLIAAVNEAGRKVDGEIERATAGVSGGLKIPGLP